MSALALALVLTPVAGAAGVAGLRHRPRASCGLALGTLAATLAAAVVAAAAEPAGTWAWGAQLELGVAVDGFARVMVVLVPAVATPVVAYGAATTSTGGGRARLLALMVSFVGAMELLVVAADLLTLLIGWELIGAFSWALIGHAWRDPTTSRAASQAFTATRVGDLGLYLAAGMAFAATGSFALGGLADAGGTEQHLIAAGVVLAAAAKSAQVPFSPWLFSAMAGPTPVSALLHSATLVSAGAYVLVRLGPDLDAVGWFVPVVTGLGLATAIGGGLVAVVQTDAKRVLAASTSAQYGLMFVAVGAGSVAAAGAHLVTHAAFKSLLFLGAGIAVHAAGSGHLAHLRLGSALPRVAALSAAGALALAAVPPLGGAWTKEQIVASAAHSGGWLVAGVLVAGFLSALYAARYQVLAYGPADLRAPRADREPPASARPGRAELASLGALAAATAGLSVLWLPGAGAIVERMSGGSLFSATRWELLVAVVLVVLAFVATWMLWRSGRLVSVGAPARVRVAVGDWLGLPALCRVAVVDPTLGLARLVARVDDQVVDAGVRAAVWLAGALSRLAWGRAEWSVDSAVHAVAAGTMGAAAASRVTDERAVDGAVEGTARAVGAGGRSTRRLQTGQAHHYYVIVAIGIVATAVVLASTR